MAKTPKRKPPPRKPTAPRRTPAGPGAAPTVPPPPPPPPPGPVAVASASPSSLTGVSISPSSAGPAGPCPAGCTVITSLQFTVSGFITPIPNPALWPVQGYVWANGYRYAALSGASVSSVDGSWTLSFDVSGQNPAIVSGTTGELKAYYTDPNDPTSYLISPICFNLAPIPSPSPQGHRGHRGR